MRAVATASALSPTASCVCLLLPAGPKAFATSTITMASVPQKFGHLPARSQNASGCYGGRGLAPADLPKTFELVR